MTDDPQASRCFRCGGPADELNELEDGVNCPACAERLLETLQGIFHTPWGDPLALEDDEAAPEPAEERAHAPRRASKGPTRTDDHPPRRA